MPNRQAVYFEVQNGFFFPSAEGITPTAEFILMALSQEFPLNVSLSTINALNLSLSQETI